MLILIGSFLVLMILGVPVALAMAVASLLYILATGIVPDVIVAQRMIAGVESFPLLAVPFFILAGNLMNIAGVTGRIYTFAVSLVGWMKGGLAQVNIIGSVIFSGMSGTGIALLVLIALDWYFDFSAVMALMTPVLLIGGMVLGWFTPTEAAVAAVIWSLFLGLVRYRSMTMQTVAKATFDTIETTASVLFIVTAASIFAWLLTVTNAAQLLSDAILGFTNNKWVFLLLANLLMLFVGCFIDTIAAITILVPILLPIVLKLGIDPIHFGLIITLNLMIGLLHPPLGMVLFVLARIARLSVERTTMAILPWLVPLLFALVAITYIPELTLWLPKYMGLAK